MSSESGYGKISTSGLTFGYDVGETINSFKGKPTTNLVPDASNMSGWSSYDNGNDGTFITEFGTTGYKMYNRGSWNGIVRGISLPSTGTYTVSVYIRYLGGASDNNGGQVYTTGGGIGDTSTGHSKVVGEWVRVSMTRTYTTTSINFYLISYGGTYNGSYSSWEVTMPQIEAGSAATQWVDGARSSTQGLLDIIGNSTLDLSNVSFDSNTQMTFDGTNDYVSVTLPSSISVYCLEMVWYNNNAIPNNDTVIGGPSTFQTPIEFNGNGQGVHLGAWTGGLTNEAIHIWGPYGVTSNRVYAEVGYHHVVFNWNGTTYDIWVDGVNTTTYYGSGTDYATLITATSIKLGNDASGYCFNGQIPITKIYNRALTASEALSNYQHYRSRFSLPAVKDGSSAALAAPNAQHLYNLGIRARGTYWIKPTGYGGSAQEIYCDFDANGGWMLVASNNAADGTIPGGTSRNNSGYYLNRSGAIGASNPNGDFIIGSMIDNLEFSKVRIIGWGFASINGTYTYPSNLGTYVTAEWNLTTTGSSRYTEKVARGNVTIGGNGTVASGANYFVLDAVQNDAGFNANSDQSTIGAAGVYSSSGDPSDGCYLGHGITEGSYEGWYNTDSSANDSQGYTTWVR